MGSRPGSAVCLRAPSERMPSSNPDSGSHGNAGITVDLRVMCWDADAPQALELLDQAVREVRAKLVIRIPEAERPVGKLPKYIAIGDGRGGISLTVSVTGRVNGGYRGHVINGAWEGTFANGTVRVERDEEVFEGFPIVWEGDKLERVGRMGPYNDYGFGYVEREIAAGRGVPA